MKIKISTGFLIVSVICLFFGIKCIKTIYDNKKEISESEIQLIDYQKKLNNLLLEKKTFVPNSYRTMYDIDSNIRNEEGTIFSLKQIIESNSKNFKLYLISSIVLLIIGVLFFIGYILKRK
jgi:hypothetical protein